MHAFQLRDPASGGHFCSWSLIEGEIDPQVTFYSDEAWFHL
jgi:hypothetical protein